MFELVFFDNEAHIINIYEIDGRKYIKILIIDINVNKKQIFNEIINAMKTNIEIKYSLISKNKEYIFKIKDNILDIEVLLNNKKYSRQLFNITNELILFFEKIYKRMTSVVISNNTAYITIERSYNSTATFLIDLNLSNDDKNTLIDFINNLKINNNATYNFRSICHNYIFIIDKKY